MLISTRFIGIAFVALGLTSLVACSSSSSTGGTGGSTGTTTATSGATSASGGDVTCDQVCSHLASACSSLPDCAAQCPSLDAATRSCLDTAADCSSASTCLAPPSMSTSTGAGTSTGSGPNPGDCNDLCKHVSSACGGTAPEATQCPAGCPAWSDLRKSCVAQMTDCNGIDNCDYIDNVQNDGHLGSACICSTTDTDYCEGTGANTGCDGNLTCYAFGRIGECSVACETNSDCPAGSHCADHTNGTMSKSWCTPN